MPFQSVTFTDRPLALEGGGQITPLTVAYETYGTLDAARGNAVLVCHGLTGDQFAAGTHPVSGRPGWWAGVIGPGKAIDTDRFFVIAPNTLGGCMGTTGPASADPATGRPYGLRFPVITIADMVAAQARLIDHLGITRLYAVAGGSMGGMQALAWASLFPGRVGRVIALAAAARHTAQNIALHELGRQAVMADPDWHDGAYAEHETFPARGLAVARMAGHITYLSADALTRKFGRRLQDRETLSYSFDADFQVESYLRHQGRSFTRRFDANSYLYITRAMDYFDLAAAHGGSLKAAFEQARARFLLVSFTSDWHYPSSESLMLHEALIEAGRDVTHADIDSDKGHDAFLLHEPEMWNAISGFLSGDR